MIVEEIECKTALSRSKLPGIDYSLNPYYGCQHGCIYCYVPNVLGINRDEWGKFVKARRNIPRILAKELKKKRKGIVGISTVTDPYQPIEKKYELTRYCLEQLLKYDMPVNIQTKSSLVCRDMDLIKKFSECAVGITISTLNDEERKLLEPEAPPIKERLATVKELAEQGIYSYIFFGPVYPTIELVDLPKIVEKFIDNGAKEIIVDSLHLKPGIWENICKRLPKDKKEIFKKRLYNYNYYHQIFAELKKICEKKMTFQRAFR